METKKNPVYKNFQQTLIPFWSAQAQTYQILNRIELYKLEGKMWYLQIGHGEESYKGDEARSMLSKHCERERQRQREEVNC